MNKKEANQIIMDYMEDDCCMCSVNSICPSPSSHHDYCINDTCKKKITHLSYNPYTRSLDELNKVWNKLAQENLSFEGLCLNLSVGANGKSFVDMQSNLDVNYGGLDIYNETGSSLAEACCIATAKFIVKVKDL